MQANQSKLDRQARSSSHGLGKAVRAAAMYHPQQVPHIELSKQPSKMGMEELKRRCGRGSSNSSSSSNTPANDGAKGGGQAGAQIECQELLLAHDLDGGTAKAVQCKHVAEQVGGREVGEGRSEHGLQARPLRR